MSKTDYSADVIVVGAGLAGLVAMRDLQAAGLRVLVFEGKDRVGGRTWSDSAYQNGAIDFGGMFVGTTHARSTALGESLGLTLVKARPAGKAVWQFDTDILLTEEGSYPDKTLSDGSSLKEALGAAFKAVDALARKVGKADAWNDGDAHELDGMTMQTWLERTVPNPDIRAIVASDVQIITGVDASELSALFFGRYVAQCEGMYALQVTSNTLLWQGGAGQISERLAAQDSEGAIHLSEPVRAIDHADDGCRITTDKGAYTARQLILALPPCAAAMIAFTPELPNARRQINRRTNFGRYMKLQIRYAKRFWLDAGLSGEIFSLSPGFFSLDVTRPDDEHATLVIFIGATPYDVWYGKGPEKRRADILEALARCLGEEARDPADYIETPWNEIPFTMGGPVCHMPPGLLTTAGPALNAPVGVIHFAGTEAAPNWTGYMEGAVQSGEAAAVETARALSILTEVA